VRLLVCPDKLKGSLTARAAAARLAEGWQAIFPGDEVVLHPVADGGDGSLAVVAGKIHGQWVATSVADALGRTREVRWWRCGDEAWIESAAVCGLAGLTAQERQPLRATTKGLGQLLRATRDEGVQRVFLCLGGSATNDAGCGMAAALGFAFLDRDGHSFDPKPADLHRLDRIEPPAQPPGAEVIALTDVRSPLLGPDGASHVYGPQKGASADDVLRLEEGLARVAEIAARDLGAPDAATPGAGAAGGLGFGVLAFLGGTLRGGFETIAAMTGLAEAVAAADLVMTGEGRLDEQTSAGKAPAGVARLARAAGKPVIAFAGSVPLTNPPDFDAVIPITIEPMTLDESMRQAGPLLCAAAARAARLVRLGQIL
jgi:glycerate 2-kinase